LCLKECPIEGLEWNESQSESGDDDGEDDDDDSDSNSSSEDGDKKSDRGDMEVEEREGVQNHEPPGIDKDAQAVEHFSFLFSLSLRPKNIYRILNLGGMIL
jgi:hypothetical protein